jgi:hypothetical protein
MFVTKLIRLQVLGFVGGLTHHIEHDGRIDMGCCGAGALCNVFFRPKRGDLGETFHECVSCKASCHKLCILHVTEEVWCI